MKKYIHSFFLSAFLVVAGCDSSDQLEVGEVDVQKDSEVLGRERGNSLYVPGGGALQFSNKASSDEVKLDSRGVKHRSVIFEFSDPVSDVYAAVDEILKSQGYSSSVLENANFKYFIRYKINGKSVVVGFRETVSEGFVRSSSVVFWWPL